ncbi:MAG: hypothetical protein A2Y53_00125 [Chloroflexi bacterium RBG_16_47_49]|nr:MAG: hypothetical protein A2Y53_00125 [Chloroflexi bacterium RBG_16_47_49]
MKCPKCGSEKVVTQIVTKVDLKHRGCIGWCIWIALSICTFGLILIIPLLTNSKVKTNTVTKAVCQECGHSWKVK